MLCWHVHGTAIVHYVLIFTLTDLERIKQHSSIKRYDGSFIEHDQGLLVDIKNSVVFPANRIDELVVDAISLKDPGLHISLLKKMNLLMIFQL